VRQQMDYAERMHQHVLRRIALQAAPA
jgi:hypothetical protein